MGAVLSVRNLRTEFRMRSANVVAVDDVSFDISEGECVGLVGESGCGKTTIGLSIMRLLQNNGHLIGGSIEHLGKDLASLSEEEMQRVRGNEIAFIPQDPMTSLNPTMNIGRQIAEGFIEHRGVSAEEGRERALEVLRLVEMPRPEERLSQFPTNSREVYVSASLLPWHSSASLNCSLPTSPRRRSTSPSRRRSWT